MDSSIRYQQDSHELAEFKKLPATPDSFRLPERPEHRVLTDKKWIVIFALAVVVLIPFLIYTLVHSDSRRLMHGLDSCGNICGYNNAKIPGVNCSGEDYTDKPYANYTHWIYISDDPQETNLGTFEFRECVRNCTFYRGNGVSLYCSTSKNNNSDSDIDIAASMNHALTVLGDSWWRFIISILITIGLCIGTLYLYRYATAIVIWTILIFSVLTIIALTVVSWYMYFKSEDETIRGNSGQLVLAIILLVLTVVILILLAVLFRKIKLVILLYKEATKAVFAMPGLIAIPVISSLAQLLVILLFLTTTLFMSTSGFLTKQSEDAYDYEPNAAMAFTLLYNAIITFWATQFIVGCQYTVVAGSVSKWFFTRNKANLGTPILTSAVTTFKYHLGSVALGSFIITLVAIIKAIVKALVKNDKIRLFLQCCIGYIEEILKFLSKNAYIEVAIHGQAFFKSGKRAARLIFTNAKSLIAVNSIGDFVLGMTQFLLIVIATTLSIAIFWVDDSDWAFMILMLLLNVVIVVVTFGVFETAVDSLFICFCEDKILNDGISKPFYMTKGLLEFVDNSKIVYGVNE